MQIAKSSMVAPLGEEDGEADQAPDEATDVADEECSDVGLEHGCPLSSR